MALVGRLGGGGASCTVELLVLGGKAGDLPASSLTSVWSGQWGHPGTWQGGSNLQFPYLSSPSSMDSVLALEFVSFTIEQSLHRRQNFILTVIIP